MISQKFHEKFPIYVAKWITPEYSVIAGGGGDGIPNRINIYHLVNSNLKLISQFDTKSEVCLSLDVNFENRSIIYTSLTRAHLYTLDKNFHLSANKSILIPSKQDIRKIKCSVFEDRVAISDDTPRVAIYDSKRLNVLRKIQTQTSVVDVILTKSVLIVVEAKKLSVFHSKTNKFMFQFVTKEKSNFRMARFKNQRVFLLESAKIGPSFVSILNLSGHLISRTKIHSKGANSMEISRFGDIDCLIVTIGEGIEVFDLNLNILFRQGSLHGFATASCDICSKGGTLRMLSGGLDNSVSFIQTQPQKSYFYWIIAVILILLSIMLYYWIK
jgi:WD40 repeat protein